MKIKFKSGLNRVYLAMVIILQLIIALLFSTKIFTTTMVGVRIGFFLLALDVIFVLPMIFLTYYEFKDDYLYIHDYPIRAYKIKYDDIFTVEDGDFEARDKSIVALSMDRIAIGYIKRTGEDENQKEEKRYIFISPAEMSLFLTRLAGRLQNNKAEFEQKAKELSEKQKEHELKKKQAQKKKAQLEKENAPEIIEAKGIKKFSGFNEKAQEEKVEKPEDNEETDSEDAGETEPETEDTENK